MANNVWQVAEQARQAYLRASNYYRAAMFSLPHTDDRLDKYLTLSHVSFHQAAQLFRLKSRSWIFPSAMPICRDISCRAVEPNDPR
ncbi:hypothetical protein TFLX_00572 [Thermoflexales bacterium]|nr:hypothetical protein TFLX_00572 [Thermoflexales bacterium]